MSIALNIEGPSHSPSRRASCRTDDWLQSLVTESMAKDSNQLTEPKVPRVPSEFRKIKENSDCYEPLVVSIGPYHHGKEKLEEMEKLKAKMAGQIVKDFKQAAEEMYSKAKELVSGARECYAEESTRQFNDEQFAQMMFLDGCFILEVVSNKLSERQKPRKEELASVTRDLILLENQLPFKVLIPLMRIYTRSGHHCAAEHTSSSKQKLGSGCIDQQFMKTVEDFFKTIHEIPLNRESCWEKISNFSKLLRALISCLKSSRSKDTGTDFELDFYHHLLEFFYFKFVYGEGHRQLERGSNREITSWNRYYSVNELKDVGISFVPNNTTVFVDVNFKNTILGGALCIPPLNIEDSTKSLLLNLAAYEACAGLYSAKCTSYVCFMRSLIDKPEDVKELRSKGILRTTIGPDDQIAKIFKEMTTNLVPNPSAYRKVKKSVESHYRNTVKRWILHYKDPISKVVVKYSFIFGIAVSAIQAYLAETKPRPALDIYQGPSHSPSRRASSSSDAWLQSLVTESRATDSNQVNEPEVPRVPSEFREMKENTDCYEPLVVSIGPYHHGKEKLEVMEKLKAKMVGQFVNDSKNAAEEMYSKVKELVSVARECYEEESTRQFNDEKFAQMMFLDGYFILQVVSKKLENQKLRKEEVASVTRDLFLLENQLPFKVLIALMRIYITSGHHSAVECRPPSSKQKLGRIDQEVMKTVEDFFKTVHEIPLHRESCWEKISIFFTKLPRALILCLKSSRSKDTDYDYKLDFYDHLLDFFYFKFVYGEGQHQREGRSNREITSWNRYYSVNELKDVGISFVPNNTTVFVDVNFKNTILGGALCIPPLNIENSTKSLLLNLAAYEACAGLYSGKCTSYVCFMRSLIDKPEDVKELRSKGILRTTIGTDDQIAQIFKEMTTILVPKPSAYRDVKNSVESHYRNTVKRWILQYKDPFSKAVVKYSFIYGIAVSAIQAYLAETKQRPNFGICSCSNATLLHY
ncbi:hypothetical protein SADUNF_Sadunf15G0016900 [Salix dunnii]|uniref:Uncharacterized protein n=1 Tax=Salix dunnii TaxID=1413687 RepID=A0A835JFG0_9ROSI|nr:hypothetical protein SADUNF_Sadunf15G0016900 [Salix dunnii]